MAPFYLYASSIQADVFKMNVLTSASSGSNYLVETFHTQDGGLNATWEEAETGGNTLYLQGLMMDQTNGALWGWGSGHNIFTNDPSIGNIVDVQSGYSSVAIDSSSLIYGTSTASCDLGNGCVYQGSSPTGTWSLLAGFFGVQTTVDTWLGDMYLLDKNGSVFHDVNGELFQNAGNVCSGGTQTFVQIAVQNGVVFGLGEHGTVWFYGGVNGSCWATVGGKSNFATSIATDNGNVTAVWASDSSGAIWVAE
jgi:hypothetical protein